MNQAELQFLVSGLRVKMMRNKPKMASGGLGYRGSLMRARTCVSNLIVNERLELTNNSATVTRLYAERLISDAILYGDRHKHTMEMAKWWLAEDKSAVHKLFKVLVPRFKDYTHSYTRILHAPVTYNVKERRSVSSGRAIVELKENPFPPLKYSNSEFNRNHLHNVLLSEAKKEFYANRGLLSTDSSKRVGDAEESEETTVSEQEEDPESKK